MFKKTVLFYIALLFFAVSSQAQEAFTIQNYEVEAKINRDASVNITEKIRVRFLESRHGIIRSFLYRYPLTEVAEGKDKAQLQLVRDNKLRIIVENVKVENHEYDVSSGGDLINIKIGSADEYVEGEQVYVIHYKLLNAINFFSDHAEFYYNVIGNQWNTTINSASFHIKLYKPLEKEPEYFVASGIVGSKGNNTVTNWEDHQLLNGYLKRPLNNFEGVTVGIAFPEGFLVKPDFYWYRGIWLFLPLLILVLMFLIWRKWGKDLEVTKVTQFYAPEGVSPGICGYVIDGVANKRDLTALVPYWGAGGYLELHEVETKVLLGLIKNKDYRFVKVKDLSDDAEKFEKTLFNGIFESGDKVMLSDLKNVLYSSLQKAKRELEKEVDRQKYYTAYSRGFRFAFVFIALITFLIAIVYFFADSFVNRWPALGIGLSAIIIFIFGLLMPKKTKKGTELYAHLLGFKEFISTVERDRLQLFLQQDEHYFDKILPYAIVFNIADKWKDKLKGLDIPQPQWYYGTGAWTNFNAVHFMNRLDKSMNTMSKTFYSPPSGGAGSGGSFRGGGGFSGGGFGGGGGSSW